MPSSLITFFILLTNLPPAQAGPKDRMGEALPGDPGRVWGGEGIEAGP